jgi:hypothetical protein
VTRDPEHLLGGEALGDALTRLWAAVEPRRAVGGWATVDLDRAADEVSAALAALGSAIPETAPPDELLGARARLLRFADDKDMLLLEPSTEGLLAASLARFGEGSVALYLFVGPDGPAAARAAGFSLSAPGSGPLGPERRVVVGPRWGPHLLLVDAPAAPPATIAP